MLISMGSGNLGFKSPPYKALHSSVEWLYFKWKFYSTIHVYRIWLKVVTWGQFKLPPYKAIASDVWPSSNVQFIGALQKKNSTQYNSHEQHLCGSPQTLWGGHRGLLPSEAQEESLADLLVLINSVRLHNNIRTFGQVVPPCVQLDQTNVNSPLCMSQGQIVS